MFEKAISIISIIFFVTVTAAPFLLEKNTCESTCCHDVGEHQCVKDVSDECFMNLTEGSKTLILPLVSAPFTKYNQPGFLTDMAPVFVEKVQITTMFVASCLSDPSLESPKGHLTPLRI